MERSKLRQPSRRHPAVLLADARIGVSVFHPRMFHHHLPKLDRHRPFVSSLVEDSSVAERGPFVLGDGMPGKPLREHGIGQAIVLDERNMAYSTCIRCQTCDGFPCLVHAKSDAETVAV